VAPGATGVVRSCVLPLHLQGNGTNVAYIDNGKQFMVMDIVIALSRGILMRVETNWMPMEIMELAYNARYCKS